MSTLTTAPPTAVRAAGVATAAGGVLLTALALEAAVGPDIGPPWFGLAAIGLAGWVAGLVALYRIDVTGSRIGRVALGVAIVAMAVFAIAHVVEALWPRTVEPLLIFGQATGSLALLIAGVAVVRARRLEGWRRVTPMLCGLWPQVVLTPVFVTVGPGRPIFFLAIAGWGLCWVGLGFALTSTARRSAPRGRGQTVDEQEEHDLVARPDRDG
jgi:hypothetical protein